MNRMVTILSLIVLVIVLGFNELTACVVPLVMIGSFFLIRLSTSLFPDKTQSVLLFLILSVTCVEILWGIAQLFIKGGGLAYSMTGSFNHPAPYAGFLVVCISLLLSHCRFSEESIIRKISLYVSAIAFILVPVTLSRTALLALLITGATLYWDNIKNLLRQKLYMIAATLTVIAGVTCLYLAKKESANGRFFMDKISMRIIAGHGLTGVGIGNFEYEYGKEQASYFREKCFHTINEFSCNPDHEGERIVATCPKIAFNDYLQIGIEAGPVVMLAYILILIVSINCSLKKRHIWGYGLLTFSLFSFFSYPLRYFEFQILTGVMIGLCSSGSTIGTRTWTNVLFQSGMVTITLLLLCIMIPDMKERKEINNEWKEIRPMYDSGYYGLSVEKLENISRMDIVPINCLYAYGHSLNKIGLYERSDSILKMGAIRSGDPMFWNILGNNSLALGRYREAEERYKHAFYMLPNRLYPLVLLAKLYNTECDTARFLYMADVIESFVPKTENYNTEQLRAEIHNILEGYNTKE